MSDEQDLPETWSETVLAYELYLRDYADAARYADGSHDAVRALSDEVRALPIHPPAIRAIPRFRNPGGVARKIQNLMWFATGKKLGSAHASDTDGRVVEALTDPDAVRRIAKATRIAVAYVPQGPIEDEDELGAPEGELLYRWHASRERDRKLVKRN